MDFEHDTRKKTRHRSTFRHILQAVKVYQSLYPGCVEIPHHFKVSETDPLWPQEMWGLNLGGADRLVCLFVCFLPSVIPFYYGLFLICLLFINPPTVVMNKIKKGKAYIDDRQVQMNFGTQQTVLTNRIDY